MVRIWSGPSPAYREALEVRTRQPFPTKWAMTQHNLGNAYGPAGAGGIAGPKLSRPSPATERPAGATPASGFPTDWARTQNNLGNALGDLAAPVEGPRAAELLQEAVEAYRAALQVCTREQLPQRLGHDPEQPGQRPTRPGGRWGPAAAELLRQAVEAFRSALEVYTRQGLAPVLGDNPEQPGHRPRQPGRHAGGAAAADPCCTGRRGLPLRPPGPHPRGPAPAVGHNSEQPGHRPRPPGGLRGEGPRAAELLQQAVEAFRSALQVRTREQLPQDWAMTQNNLGIALRDLAAGGGPAGRRALAGGRRGLPGRPPGPHPRAAAPATGP